MPPSTVWLQGWLLGSYQPGTVNGKELYSSAGRGACEWSSGPTARGHRPRPAGLPAPEDRASSVLLTAITWGLARARCSAGIC